MEENFKINIKTQDEYYYLKSLLEFLLLEFNRLFGEKKMCEEDCVIFNDSDANCPMLIINESPIKIRLAQPSLIYWAQTIYQLAHELGHYALRQYKNDKNFTLSWFEEIVCEALSLYFLHWSSENWQSCELGKLYPNFKYSLKEYLINELKRSGNDVFKNCTTIQQLLIYEKNFAAAFRETHLNETNALFYQIIKDPEACSCFCEYVNYLNSDNLTLDFVRWGQENNNLMIRFLSTLQPNIEGTIGVAG